MNARVVDFLRIRRIREKNKWERIGSSIVEADGK